VNNRDSFEKLRVAFFLALFAGVAVSAVRLAYFLITETYAWWELERFGMYFLWYQVNVSVLWALAAGSVFLL
jgi:hypothetical protein